MDILGTTWPVFIGITILLMGFASFMTGQAVASTWRPMWQVVPYTLLLGLADRFLTWGLFDGQLFLLSGYIADSLVLMAIAALAYRLTLAHKMVTQYPWIYERTGPFTWREKTGA
ncbi:MAG TPA: hypothetical protein VGA60_03950 [Kiloniellales bacterium]|jgi:hypothetical protein